MSKVRIYELAKEMNTTSKRLMEKLGEIKIDVKNHMSFLEEHELNALYDYIGIIRNDGTKKSDSEEKKHTPVAAQPVAQKHENKPEQKKNVPRIIRTTEIVVDTNEVKKDDNKFQNNRYDQPKNDNRRDVRDGYRQDSMRSTNSGTGGLRPGFVRDTGYDLKNSSTSYNDRKPIQRNNSNQQNKPEVRLDNKHENTQVARNPVNQEIKHEAKPDINAEIKLEAVQEANHEVKKVKMAEAMTDVKQQVKPDVEPKISAEISNEIKQEKPQENQNDPRSEQNRENEKDNMQGLKAEVKVEEKAQIKNESQDVTKIVNNSETTPKQDAQVRQQSDIQKDSTGTGNNVPSGERRPYYNRNDVRSNNNTFNRDNNRGPNTYNRDNNNAGGYNRNNNTSGGYNRDNNNSGGYNRDNNTSGGYNRDNNTSGGYNRDNNTGGGYNRDNNTGGGYNRDNNTSGGYNRDNNTSGGYNRDNNNSGGYNRDNNNSGGYNRSYNNSGTYNNNNNSSNTSSGNTFNKDRKPYTPRPYTPNGENRPYNKDGNTNTQQRSNSYDNRSGGFRGNSTQGRPSFGNNYDRPGGANASRPKATDLPKIDMTEAQKDEMSSQRTETRREFQNKDVDKDVKRDQKRDTQKTQVVPGKEKRFKPQKVVLSEKKGLSEVMSDNFVLEELFEGDTSKFKKQPRPKKNFRAMDANRHIPHKAVLTSVTIPETIIVKDLAETLKKTSTEVIKKLMALGLMATLNQELDFDTATLIADEFGIKTEKQIVVSEEDILFDDADDKEDDTEPRPPVVVVMGHVDHGKTSLLDAIRKTSVMESEAGGITQHIGAYTVTLNNRNITFLDTPGHEAFTAMRARGAQATDIAILVVAADDGIMPQTIEAINHAKAAKVSIIVAINKIDKPGADPEKVKQELTKYELVAEEWGGDIICVPVSAKNGTNIDHLLEMVLLTADVLELKSNPNKQAKGTVIEAKLDKGRGPVATVLVQRGTLKVGDSIVTGTTVGRIRAMLDDKGNTAKKAGPSTPVEILGLPEVPEAGDVFYAITDEKVAKHLVEKRKNKQREKQMKTTSIVTLEDLYNQIKEGKVKELNIIVKADVQGSVEAVSQSLAKLSNDEVRVKTIHGAVGAITETDVSLAAVSNAIIIGFNVRPGTNVADMAKEAGVDLRLYRIIYNAIEDIEAAMKGMLEPTFTEVIQGHAEIRQIFKVSDIGTIGGSYVTDGKINRNSDVRIVRNGIVVHEGKLISLKRFKDDAKEVAQGFECGISIEKFNDIKEGDIVEAYSMEEVKR